MEKIERQVLLNIDQVSKLTGVRKSTLRYWEKCFPEFLKPERTDSRRREYHMQDLDLIDTIRKLLAEEQLTNQGVRLHLGKHFGSAAKKFGHPPPGRCRPRGGIIMRARLRCRPNLPPASFS